MFPVLSHPDNSCKVTLFFAENIQTSNFKIFIFFSPYQIVLYFQLGLYLILLVRFYENKLLKIIENKFL